MFCLEEAGLVICCSCITPRLDRSGPLFSAYATGQVPWLRAMMRGRGKWGPDAQMR